MPLGVEGTTATNIQHACWVAALHHEAGDKSVEDCAVILLACRQRKKIFTRLWCLSAYPSERLPVPVKRTAKVQQS